MIHHHLLQQLAHLAKPGLIASFNTSPMGLFFVYLHSQILERIENNFGPNSGLVNVNILLKKAGTIHVPDLWGVLILPRCPLVLHCDWFHFNQICWKRCIGSLFLSGTIFILRLINLLLKCSRPLSKLQNTGDHVIMITRLWSITGERHHHFLNNCNALVKTWILSCTVMSYIVRRAGSTRFTAFEIYFSDSHIC